MEVKLTSTTKIVSLNGVPARIWEGHTAAGIACHAYVTRIAVLKDDDASEFERDLQEHSPPSADVRAIPISMII